jgi:hypothetical protein
LLCMGQFTQMMVQRSLFDKQSLRKLFKRSR